MIWDFDLTLTDEPPEVYATVVATSLEALRCGQAAPPAGTAANAWTRMAFELTRDATEGTKAEAKSMRTTSCAFAVRRRCTTAACSRPASA